MAKGEIRVEPKSLPPTSAAAKFHSYRVFLLRFILQREQGRKCKKAVAVVVAVVLKVVAVAEVVVEVAAMVAAAVVVAVAAMAAAMVAKDAAVVCYWAGADTIGQGQ